MHHFYSRSLILVVLLFSASSSLAAASQPINNVIIAILDELGIVDLVNNIPKTMQDGFAQKQQEQGVKHSDYNKKMSYVVEAFFTREKILDMVSTRLQSRFKASRLETIKRLLDSPTASEFISIKKNARSTDGIEAIKALAVLHEDLSLDSERLKLYEAFDNATADTEFYVASQALSIDAIYRITNAFTKQQPVAGSDLLSSTYMLLLRPSKYTTMMTYQYMFENSSIENIKKYTQIYRQKQMQVLLEQVMIALTAAMQDASEMAIKEVS